MLPALADPPDNEAMRFGERALSYAELAEAAAGVAAACAGATRVAVWATSTLETCVGVVGALLAGVPVVPINPKSGERELAHIVADSAPELVIGGALEGVAQLEPSPGPLPPEPPADAPAFVVYTSGTTGPPKGVVLPRAAIATNLDALAAAWEWTGADVLAHALPLFHVHGLILGMVGPLRLGGTLHHLERFSPAAVAAAFGPATMLFGVPTMYHRLADEAEQDPSLAAALGRARLLVSGSAALPAYDHERLQRLTGRHVVERYGMTETLMITAIRASGEPRPGTVGPPLDGVDVRLVDDDGAVLDVDDDETIGELQVRGPMFLEYLNRPEATAEAMTGGWFRTGDMATRGEGGYIRLVGRRATDIIKSGGFKIGAGEIEGILLEHPGVAEVAVTGEPDDDLGERIVAWVVPVGERPSERELADHVAAQLAPHKRPREVHYLEALPRNAMGKVLKKQLSGPPADR